MSFFSKHHRLIKRASLVLLFCSAVLLTTHLSLRYPAITSASTTAFCFLIIVLLSAFLGDIFVAIATSLLATLCFDYYYLIPIGTFTIAAFPDVISLVAFLLTSVIISHLTASAAEHAVAAKKSRQASAQLKEFSAWLLATRDDLLTLSKIAQEAMRIFSLDYCSVHVYGEGKWHHFTGTAGGDISKEIEGTGQKFLGDHPTDLQQLAEESVLGARFVQIRNGAVPHALLVVKGPSLPSNTAAIIAGMIDLRLFGSV
jgi:K+-sensing histidine kinase KdpD